MGKPSRAEWLEERRTGIGGSDSSAVLGLNPWMSPYSLWADKLGMLPEREESEAMRQGRDFEDYVARRFCEVSGKRVRRVNKILRHPENSFMLANIDRDIVGEDSGLECKTTSMLNLKKYAGGDFPVNYYCQCVHYMAVTGAKRWYLAVLVLNQALLCFQLTREPETPVPEWCVSSVYVDQSEIDSLVDAERSFWALVEAKEPPPLDGAPPTTDALEAIYADSNGSSIELFGRESLIETYAELKAQSRELDARIAECRQILMGDLGEAERGNCGSYDVLWKSQSRKTFDSAAFFSDFPELKESAEDYWKTTSFRKFEIREVK